MRRLSYPICPRTDNECEYCWKISLVQIRPYGGCVALGCGANMNSKREE